MCASSSSKKTPGVHVAHSILTGMQSNKASHLVSVAVWTPDLSLAHACVSIHPGQLP